MIGLILMAAALHSVYPAPPGRDPASVKAYEFKCRVMDEDLKFSDFQLEQTGGRAFRNSQGALGKTLFALRVVSDSSGLTRSYSGGGAVIGEYGLERRAVIAAPGQPRREATLLLLPARNNKLALQILMNSLPDAGKVLAGFCDKIGHPQASLSPAETVSYLERFGQKK